MDGQDRAQRLIVGVILLAINITNSLDATNFSTLNLIAMLIQVELIVTALVGWCPFYWSISYVKRYQTKKK